MNILNVNIDGLQGGGGGNKILTANYIKQNNFEVLNLQEVKFSSTNNITNES